MVNGLLCVKLALKVIFLPFRECYQCLSEESDITSISLSSFATAIQPS